MSKSSPEQEPQQDDLTAQVMTHAGAAGCRYAWLESRLERKLVSAMFSEIREQKKAELSSLLAGHDVKATSLKYGFAVADGYGMTSGPGSPREITAPFYTVEPARGIIWVGTPEEHYRIELWDVMDNTQPASVIEVL